MNIEFARRQMVEQQVRTWEVRDSAVLEVMGRLRREDFVPAEYVELAFAETTIPVGHGQFMMMPSVEGRLLQALRLTQSDRVLEVGTGSGFLTACLASLSRAVTSIDIFADFTVAAGRKLKQAGLANTTLDTMDAARELPGDGFDAVAVTASLPMFDSRFFEILNPGGRLFVIVGKPPIMDAQLVTRAADGSPRVSSLFETEARPLLNALAPPAFDF